MLKLSMAASGSGKIPAIVFEQFDGIADFHTLRYDDRSCDYHFFFLVFFVLVVAFIINPVIRSTNSAVWLSVPSIKSAPS